MNPKRLLLLSAVCLCQLTAWAAEPYKIVVHSANPATTLGRDELARLFLKKTTTWPSGRMVAPVDQAKDSATRREFSRAVLGKDADAVASYWQQAIFSGRGVPPPEKGSDAAVVGFVGANPDAIGYVSAGAELGPSVKELVVR
jgi:ABC-type phosphate transport system substrate-binding protein